MINRPIFAFLLHILMMDFAHSCDDFQRVVKSEIFPDGGSIGLKLESGCKSVHFVKYVKPLRGDEVLSLNGVAVLPGTKDEVLLIQRLDNLVKKAAKNKSLQNFQNAEMKRFVGGGQNTLTPLFALVEGLCANDQTRRFNGPVCKKYVPRS